MSIRVGGNGGNRGEEREAGAEACDCVAMWLPSIDSSPSFPPGLDWVFNGWGRWFCHHWLLLMFFNYIPDTVGNMFVNTKVSRSWLLVTLSERHPLSLSDINQWGQEGSSVSLVLECVSPSAWTWAFIHSLTYSHLKTGELFHAGINWVYQGRVLPGSRLCVVGRCLQVWHAPRPCPTYQSKRGLCDRCT